MEKKQQQNNNTETKKTTIIKPVPRQDSMPELVHVIRPFDAKL